MEISESHFAPRRNLVFRDWNYLSVIVLPLTFLLNLTSCPSMAANTLSVDFFDQRGDVGEPKLEGSTVYDADRQQYRVRGAGYNMWFKRDEFHAATTACSGDFLIRARLSFVGEGTDPHRKAGILIRQSMSDDSPYVDVAAHGDGLVCLQFRRTKGGNTEQITSELKGADVVQLKRKGEKYSMSVAQFGEPFSTASIDLPEIGDQVQAGLFVCSHNEQVVEEAVFSDVRLVRPAPDNFVPYRDYIGSRLEIMEVSSGHRRIVHETQDSMQAPNWTRDGKALIYNRNGKLYRFDIESGVIKEIPTDFATSNNNDHVISFDGIQLGISHHAKEFGGRSVIYTVPIEGGVPKQVTTGSAHSYFHSWSPDDRWLVFTGQREGKFDIYKIPSQGGDEVRLTANEVLDDGAEFTPDGEWIYYNSIQNEESGTGRMQLWRMRPAGTQHEQITNDEYNNWFPHISPNGKWVVYIAFPSNIDPSDHPFYREVMLRLIPRDGGKSKTIAYLYGGQGTINVPSWSPDSKHIAFVSNSNDITINAE